MVMLLKCYNKIWIITLCLSLALVLVYIKVGDTVAVNAQAQLDESSSFPIIVIDAGHGGEDGGAVSPTGLLEKDVNLSVAKYLKSLFLQSGYEVVMIREEDKAIYDSDAQTLREKKTSDLHNRSDICNSDSRHILLSIHQNKFEYSKYSGTQVFYSKNDPLSQELAENIRLSVKDLIQRDNNRNIVPATSSIYILDKATVPAVLVECGFLSNPEEENLLKNESYKQELALTVYLGFMNFINTNT